MDSIMELLNFKKTSASTASQTVRFGIEVCFNVEECIYLATTSQHSCIVVVVVVY